MQQISRKRIQDYEQLGGKGDLLGIGQEIKFSPCYEMVYTQTKE